MCAAEFLLALLAAAAEPATESCGPGCDWHVTIDAEHDRYWAGRGSHAELHRPGTRGEAEEALRRHRQECEEYRRNRAPATPSPAPTRDPRPDPPLSIDFDADWGWILNYDDDRDGARDGWEVWTADAITIRLYGIVPVALVGRWRECVQRGGRRATPQRRQEAPEDVHRIAVHKSVQMLPAQSLGRRGRVVLVYGEGRCGADCCRITVCVLVLDGLPFPLVGTWGARRGRAFSAPPDPAPPRQESVRPLLDEILDQALAGHSDAPEFDFTGLPSAAAESARWDGAER